MSSIKIIIIKYDNENRLHGVNHALNDNRCNYYFKFERQKFNLSRGIFKTNLISMETFQNYLMPSRNVTHRISPAYSVRRG